MLLIIIVCRRHIQLTQCGFHSPVSKPYKDMGTVVMDDGKLIMESLGQAKDENVGFYKWEWY